MKAKITTFLLIFSINSLCCMENIKLYQPQSLLRLCSRYFYENRKKNLDISKLTMECKKMTEDYSWEFDTAKLEYLKFSKNSKYLICVESEDKKIKLINLHTENFIEIVPTYKNNYSSINDSYDGKFFILKSEKSDEIKAYKIDWLNNKADLLLPINCPSNNQESLDFSSDNKYFAVAVNKLLNKKLNLYQLCSENPFIKHVCELDNINELNFSSNGKFIFAYYFHFLKIYSVYQLPKIKKAFINLEFKDNICSVIFSTSNKVAIITNKEILIYDFSELIHKDPKHLWKLEFQDVDAAIFSPRNNYFVFRSGNKRYIYSVENILYNNNNTYLKSNMSLNFSYDDRYIGFVNTKQNCIDIFDLYNNEFITSYEIEDKINNTQFDLVAHEDGFLFAYNIENKIKVKFLSNFRGQSSKL